MIHFVLYAFCIDAWFTTECQWQLTELIWKFVHFCTFLYQISCDCEQCSHVPWFYSPLLSTRSFWSRFDQYLLIWIKSKSFNLRRKETLYEVLCNRKPQMVMTQQVTLKSSVGAHFGMSLFLGWINGLCECLILEVGVTIFTMIARYVRANKIWSI